MPRVKRGVRARKRKKKVLKLAKGYYGGRSRLYRTAREAVNRALQYAYIGRKLRKRDFRKLWIERINAAARINGISYSKLMGTLKKHSIELDRKMLADIAIHDPHGFAKIVSTSIE
ncbi:MAG: 50S ribosomal protein L20 [Thermodesulfobacteriota bacterium]|nr:50S ribosomal protein L20 [Thermodesulfobacteriota bacterium]